MFNKISLLFLIVFSFFFGNAQIIINEVEADAGNFENAGGEWIELKNIGSVAQDVSCWKISNGASEVSFPVSLNIPAGGYLLIGNGAKMTCPTCDYKYLDLQFALNSFGFGGGNNAYTNTIFLNTDISANGGCDCLTGPGTLNNGSGNGDRIVLFDENGNIMDAMMYGGGNNYGSGNLTVNFNSTPSCAPLPGIIIPNVASSVYDGRIICNDVTSCNSSFARLPDGNNGTTVTWSQTGNLGCNNCTNPCGALTNTASDDMPTPGLDNSVNTWSASLNGNPMTASNATITVCGATPVIFTYESNNYVNTALSSFQSNALLGSYVTTNNGTPTNFTSANFNTATGVTTLTAIVTAGAGTTNYTFVMGDANTNCSSCPGTTAVLDVNNTASAAKECYVSRTVTVQREEPLAGSPTASCSILGSVIISGATGTNVKYELQKQIAVNGPFTTIAGPQNGNSFGGVIDDDADPALPNYQVIVSTQNTVCNNTPTLTVAVPITCLGNPACAAFVTTNPGLPTFTPATNSNVCAGSTVQFSVDITGVCTNGNVDVLYDYNPSFDPYTQGTLLGSALTTVGTTPPTTTASSRVYISEIAPNVYGNGTASDAFEDMPLSCGLVAGADADGSSPNSGEYLELYNPGPGNVDISGWMITDGDWTARVPSGTTIIAGNWFLIGGGGTKCITGVTPDLNVETCNCTTGPNLGSNGTDFMNLSNSAEYIMLLDCSGNMIDQVRWGSPTDATQPNGLATGCGNYMAATANFTFAVPTATSSVNRARDDNGAWTITINSSIVGAGFNGTPKADNAPGGTGPWNGGTTTLGTQCPPPPVTVNITVTLPDTCSQFNTTNLTLKAIYKPDPVTPCTKSSVTATADYTIPPCTLLTVSGNGEYCEPNSAPITLTPSDPLVGNYDVTMSNGVNTASINGISGAGPFTVNVSNSGLWSISNIVPPSGICAPKKVGAANILINPIPAIIVAPDTVKFCYLYGQFLSDIEPNFVTNPPANTYTWYDSLVGGNVIFPTYVNPSVPTTYYAEPSTGFPAYCTGTRIPVVLDISPIPDVPNISCVNDTLKILPLAQNCIPTPCAAGVDYSANGTNWSSNTAYTIADPGWAGWGTATNSSLYIRNASLPACYVIVNYFAPCNYPLPTTLFAFTGNVIGDKKIQIDWQTSAEDNVLQYEIERSSNKSNFEKIGLVKAEGGLANKHQYSFIDEKALAGNNYYRIKIVDKDRLSMYSNVINVVTQIEQLSVGNIYPNPSSTNIQFDIQAIKKDKATLEILDVLSKTLYKEEWTLGSGNNLIQIPTTALANGNYILKCSFGKSIEYRKFVKE